MIKWYTENPVEPRLRPNSNVSMYYEVEINYQQYPTATIKEFEEKCKQQTRVKIEKINSILKSKNIIFIFLEDFTQYKRDVDLDNDLTDFKFLQGDTLVYKDKIVKVKEHLDEMIEVEEVGNSVKKQEWVEKDNPKLRIRKLVQSVAP